MSANPGQVRKPTSGMEAQQMLTELKLPAPRLDILAKIGTEEGEQFKTLLSQAFANPGDMKLRGYLMDVLTAYSPYTANVIQRIGMEPPTPQQLLPVVRDNGKAFRSAVKSIGEGMEAKEEIAYLKSTLSIFVHPRTLPADSQVKQPRQSENDTSDSFSGNPMPLRQQEGMERGDATSKPLIESSHFYGKKSAFCFTKDKTQTGGYPTITIDAALAVPGNDRQYDWKNKCAFQLSVGELPLVYGVFTGLLSELQLVGHGRANNKSISIKDQETGYYLTMQMGSEQSFAIPAIAKDTYRIMAMLLEQMKANSPGLSTADIHFLVKRTCMKHVNPTRRAAS